MLLWVPEGTDEEYLAGLPDTVEIGYLPLTDRELPADSGRVEFLIAPWPQNSKLFGSQVKQLPSLRVVQSFAAGVEALVPHIPARVTLCNGRGLHDSAVSEWCVGAVLAVYNKFSSYQRLQDWGKWNHIETDTLEGHTITILGYGSIGKAVEKRLAGFDVVIQRVARTTRLSDDGHQIYGFDQLNRVLASTHVLINLLPLTEQTSKLLDKAKLALLPNGALVVNAGRGKSIDTDALIAELSAGRLYAALDVTDPEPIPEGHALWTTPNIMLTQHSSGSSSDYYAKVYPFVHEQVKRYMDGAPLMNVVGGDY
jgi:phosphoglycerate dehydrogenase-like enzyme